MSFLLDTNVLSEWQKERPNAGVVRWLHEVDEDRVYLSVVTLAELRFGVQRLAGGRRRQRLEAWLTDDLPARFEARLLAVDASIADDWGRLMADRATKGRPAGAMDGLLGATARVHSLTVVTRNKAHFAPDVTVHNPWT